MSRLLLMSLLLMTLTTQFAAEAQVLLTCYGDEGDCTRRCKDESCTSGSCQMLYFETKSFNLCYCNSCKTETPTNILSDDEEWLRLNGYENGF